MWFHQHFNTGTNPARYFAMHYGYWRVVLKDLGPESLHENAGNQIAYSDEDPEVLDYFMKGLEENGARPRPFEEWRKKVT
jgi:hypothetical protein